jgi:hypothetical protein
MWRRASKEPYMPCYDFFVFAEVQKPRFPLFHVAALRPGFKYRGLERKLTALEWGGALAF